MNVSVTIAIGFVSTAVTLYWIVQRIINSYRMRDKKVQSGTDELPYPPCPSQQHPLWGHAHLMPTTGGPAIETVLLRFSRELGTTIFSYSVPIIGKIIVVADPDLANHVLTQNHFPKSPIYRLAIPLVGKRSMVITADKAAHQSRRRLFHKGFQPGYLKEFCLDIMKEKTVELLVKCAETEGSCVPMLNLAKDYTSQIISAVAFGQDWSDAQQPVRVAIHGLAECVTKTLEWDLSGKKFDPLLFYRCWKYQRDYHREMKKIVEMKMENPGTGSDILSATIRDFLREKPQPDEEDVETITDNLKTIYVAGHETTSNLISWVVWLLAQHPDVLQKLRSEMDVIFDSNWQAATADQLSQCVYLDAVIKEVLRLYPATSISRSVPLDTKASTWNGYRLDGATVLVCPYVMHRSPENWGPDADVFRPERFVEKLNPKAYMPFSKGVYDCLGRAFGMLEAKISIAALTTSFDIEAIEPEMEYECLLMTLQPKHGCRIKLTPRQPMNRI